MSPAPRHILFVCYANACRSQMAEGFARALGPSELQVESAGIIAAGLLPATVAAMAKVGVDISGQKSKTVWELDLDAFDLIVTLSDQARGQLLSLHPELPLLHRPVLDPVGIPGNRADTEEIFALTREDVRGVVIEVLAGPKEDTASPPRGPRAS
jgi:arsenate reductase